MQLIRILLLFSTNRYLPAPQAQLQSVVGNQHWTVRRSVNTLFTGREKILDDIKRALQPNNDSSALIEQKRFVITGLGGQGKSEICLKLADLMREESVML